MFQTSNLQNLRSGSVLIIPDSAGDFGSQFFNLALQRLALIKLAGEAVRCFGDTLGGKIVGVAALAFAHTEIAVLDLQRSTRTHNK